MNKLILLAILFNAFVLPVHAFDIQAQFHGTLVEPPSCEVNGAKPIDVDFGSQVVTTEVDGVNYIKPVTFTLDCKNNPKNTMRMQFSGTAPSWDTKVLTTNNTNLGIKLLQGSGSGTQLSLNTWLSFTYPTLPVLQAVPVKKTGSTLTAGAFNGTATLKVEFI
ncbi:fimbrial protein [Pantoea dispersa]|uniref:fimbrial protein n=1 Tax=Pantoea dispersa TaxID=59814 RepID=UPI0035275070